MNRLLSVEPSSDDANLAEVGHVNVRRAKDRDVGLLLRRITIKRRDTGEGRSVHLVDGAYKNNVGLTASGPGTLHRRLQQ